MKRLALLFIIFILAPCFLGAAEEELSLTLDEAVVLALKDNRDILLKAEDVKKAQAKIAEAKAALWPTLTFTGSWLYTRGLYAKDYGQTTTQTTLRHTLYQGGKVSNSIQSNEYARAMSQAILDKTKLETVLNVQKAFYTFLLASDFANCNKEIVENTKAHLAYLQARYDKGQASGSDILRIKESLSNVQEAYEASVNQVALSAALLKNLLYIEEKVKIKLQGDFEYDPQEFAFDEAFVKAMKTRPEIKQYEAQENAAKKGVAIAKAGSRPDISVAADYYGRSHAGAGGVSLTAKNQNDYETIGFTFSWPIFDGWLTKAKVDQAIVDLKEARLAKEKAVKDIALELKDAYLSLNNAIAQVRTAQAEAALYQDTLSSIKQKHGSGIASSLDLADASLGYNISLFNQKQSIYDYIIAKFNFDKATGGL
jgi:outer membrane protein TolC